MAFRTVPAIIHLTENGGSLIFPLCCLSKAVLRAEMRLNCSSWQPRSDPPAAATQKDRAGKAARDNVFLACYLPATAEK